MSQLPTSPFPKRGTSGPGNVFRHPLLTSKPGKETFTEQLESLGSHQSAQTVNSELCIMRQ